MTRDSNSETQNVDIDGKLQAVVDAGAVVDAAAAQQLLQVEQIAENNSSASTSPKLPNNRPSGTRRGL
jgi:hypothetical protein